MIANDDLQIQQTSNSFGFYNQGRFSFAGYLEADIMKVCKVEGCDKKHSAKGYCKGHYTQIQRHGKIKNNKLISFKNKITLYDDYAEIEIYNIKCEPIAYAKIDLEDVKKVKDIKWHLIQNTYAVSYNKGIFTRLHRLIMETGEYKGYGDLEIDHIDGNGLNNRKANLRIVTHQENMFNLKLAKNNTSGYRGICFDKYSGKWLAQIAINRKHINLGLYENKKEAIRVRKNAEVKYYGKTY